MVGETIIADGPRCPSDDERCYLLPQSHLSLAPELLGDCNSEAAAYNLTKT
jgi:hypothetical protein